MANSSCNGGKLFVLTLLFISASLQHPKLFVVCDLPSVETERESGSSVDSTLLDLKHRQLEKLEQLVNSLSELVDKLESKFKESPVKRSLDESDSVEDLKSGFNDRVRTERKNDDFGEGLENREDKERAKAVPVTKYSPLWSERFPFVSAVKLNSDATCIHVLPFRDYEGFSKYVGVGDDRGRVYVFSRNGDVLVDFHTVSDSPVTAMLSYMSVYKNESFVVTGHQNGAVLVHKVWESVNGEDWSPLSAQKVGEFGSEEDGLEITILELHHVGRTRYILTVDAGGKIRVFRDNGTPYGFVVPNSRPLAFLKQRLLFLTESGAGSLDLRNMKIRESECEGLNSSLVRNYVFDANERSKAYGFTSDGDLIHVLLLGDVMNFKCRVRFKRKFDIVEPLVFQTIKGYLLVVSDEKVFVYNVSSQHYVRVGGPRLLFSAGLDEIRLSFLNNQVKEDDAEGRKAIPLIASDREKLIVLGLGGGYVGMYRSNLPIFKNEFNTMLWTSPVLFFVLFLFGAWQFFAKKKEALTSWGPDDPFSSTAVTGGAPLGSGPGDRSFTESSRGSDMMELRGRGLGGASRTYVSPARFPGGAASSFRPSSVDPGSRPPPVDPNYRTGTELKYRGPNLESTVFPKRRETLFGNSPVVDESS